MDSKFLNRREQRDLPAKPDETLTQEMDRYASYFADVVGKAYDPASPSGYSPQYYSPQWKPPMDAVQGAFDNPWERSPKWEGIDRDTFFPSIDKWLKDNRITDLSLMAHGYNGWTAACFAAKFSDTPVMQVVCVGSEKGTMPHLSAQWGSPFLLQSDALGMFICKESEDAKLVISRKHCIPMVPPREPVGFDDFLNRHILVGTPYAVKDHKDLSVLPDGTPVYGDPDSIGFATDALAQHHEKDQWNPAWQQEIMRTIHANSERIKLPDSLRLVVETSPGVFANKQSVLLPDPLRHAVPERLVTYLEPAVEKAAPVKQARPQGLTQ